ncbi:hypothetical protein KKF91_20470 [Myxococcota bacterium]|nr:hypothetical protein [Myxococcota bacterium]MBU1432921.1 hypothetical protein [Myxococcota bacterium]MBU1899673.1 hypothetical protein [Myxococcota bacterium]
MSLLLTALIGLLGQDLSGLEAWRPDQGRVALAVALAEAALPRLSTAVLVEALLLNSAQPAKRAAALDLYPLSLRGAPPPVLALAALEGADKGGLSPAHLSLEAFIAGQALLASGQPQWALTALARVAPGGPAYAPAQHLMAVAWLTPPLNDLRRASGHLRAAIEEAEVSPQGARAVVQEARRLALMGLARLFYEVGDFEVALYYYRRLPPDAPELGQAVFEAALAHLFRGDMHRALGALHATRSPLIRHPYHPELHLIRGAALLGLCRYTEGRAELDALQQTYLIHRGQLEAAASALRAGQAIQARPYLVEGGPLHVQLRRLLRAQPPVARALAEEAAVEAERRRLATLSRTLARPLDEAKAAGAGLAGAQAARVERATRQTLLALDDTLTYLSDARDELLIDVLEAQGEALRREIQGARVGEVFAPQAATPALGEDWQRWAFEGEAWPDELLYYRDRLPSQCRPKEAASP